MVDEAAVDPKLGESTPTPEPAPAEPVNAGPATPNDVFTMPDKLVGKSAEEIARIYVDTEKQLGTMSTELGTVRGERDQYLPHYNWYQSTHMENPNDPKGDPVHRELYELQQTAQPQQQPGQLTQEQIDDELRTMQEEKPQEYFQLAVDYAAKKIQEGQTSRNTLFATPAAQQVLSKHPDVGQRAEQIAMEQNIPLESALHMAAGEKMFGAAQGATAPVPAPPSVNLTLGNAGRTFLDPTGTIPGEAPKSLLSQDTIARAHAMYPANEVDAALARMELRAKQDAEGTK